MTPAEGPVWGDSGPVAFANPLTFASGATTSGVIAVADSLAEVGMPPGIFAAGKPKQDGTHEVAIGPASVNFVHHEIMRP